MVQDPSKSISSRRVTHSGNSMRHPKFKHVFCWGTLSRASNMAVHIDQARQKIVPGQVHYLRLVVRFGTAIFVDRNARITNCLNLRNAIFLYHNIHRTYWGCPGTVNKRHSTNNQFLIRALSLCSCRGRHDLCKGPADASNPCKTEDKYFFQHS